MPKTNENLGGRIPLSDPQSLTPPQQSLYDTINQKMVPWAEAAGFQAKLDDGKLIGPFNLVLQSPELGAAFLKLQGAEEEHTSLSKRVRQVVILTVGAVWQSDYERYAHTAVARKAGLPDSAIAALANGDVATELTAEEKVAQRFTKQLTADNRIEQDLFDAAKDAFGVRGIVDMIVLAGCYDTVSSLLNAFAVPAPQANTAHR